MNPSPHPPAPGVVVRLGLRENLPQFSLLVPVNAFVGAMVGLERSILPAMAEHEFQLAPRTAVLSFIVVFGVFILNDPPYGPNSVTTPCASPGRWRSARARR